MISKELFSEVLGFNVVYVETCTQTIKSRIKSDVSDSDIAVYDGNKYSYINIHELAHKCKEWAYSKGFRIVDEGENVFVVNFEKRVVHLVERYDLDSFSPERCFIACQWILDNKESK